MWIAVGIGMAIGIFLAFQFLLFLFSFSPAVAWMLDRNVVAFLKDVIGPVSAGFGGAVAGAYAAFKFQTNSEERKELKSAARTLSVAKLNLMQKLNDLCSIKKHNIYQHRDHLARFVVIGELPESPGVREPIDPGIIDLLITARESELISTVLLADKRYEACFENFKLRNKAIREYRGVVNSSEIGMTLNTSLAEVCKIVEPARLVALHQNTEGVLEAFDDSIETLQAALKGIAEALDKRFDGTGLVIMTIGNQEGEYLEKLPPSKFTLKSLTEFIQRNKGS